MHRKTVHIPRYKSHNNSSHEMVKQRATSIYFNKCHEIYVIFSPFLLIHKILRLDKIDSSSKSTSELLPTASCTSIRINKQMMKNNKNPSTNNWQQQQKKKTTQYKPNSRNNRGIRTLKNSHDINELTRFVKKILKWLTSDYLSNSQKKLKS